jgi:hypothetical protein
MTSYLTAESRYHSDTTYRAMVDFLSSVIAKLEMTPAEVREAADMRRGLVPDNVVRDMQEELDLCQERARKLGRWLSGEGDR